jgi:hypothetical protein
MGGQKIRHVGERLLPPNEFRVFAKECLDWAKTAKSDNERDIFLQMEQFWLEAAMRSESGPTQVDRARHNVLASLAQRSPAQVSGDLSLA